MSSTPATGGNLLKMKEAEYNQIVFSVHIHLKLAEIIILICSDCPIAKLTVAFSCEVGARTARVAPPPILTIYRTGRKF